MRAQFIFIVMLFASCASGQLVLKNAKGEVVDQVSVFPFPKVHSFRSLVFEEVVKTRIHNDRVYLTFAEKKDKQPLRRRSLGLYYSYDSYQADLVRKGIVSDEFGFTPSRGGLYFVTTVSDYGNDVFRLAVSDDLSSVVVSKAVQ